LPVLAVIPAKPESLPHHVVILAEPESPYLLLLLPLLAFAIAFAS
jgi:hypothetical protein